MPKSESRSDNARNDSKWQATSDDIDIILGIGALRANNRWQYGYVDFRERCAEERDEREERKRQRKSQCKDRTADRYLESECKLAPYRGEWNQSFGEDEDEPKVRANKSNKKFKTNTAHSEPEGTDQQETVVTKRRNNNSNKSDDNNNNDKCTIQ